MLELSIVLAAVLVATALLLPRVSAARRLAVRRRVVVNLEGGDAVTGVLWARRGDFLVLRDAMVHTGGRDVPADGEVIIDRERVIFVQVT